MPTKPATHGEVKSIIDSLECSPSKSQASSNIYSGSSDNPKAKSHSPKHKSGAGGTLTSSESGFGQKGKGKRRNLATKL